MRSARAVHITEARLFNNKCNNQLREHILALIVEADMEPRVLWISNRPHEKARSAGVLVEGTAKIFFAM